MYIEMFDLISKYDTIVIFRHIDGDGDALGSQWGLYYYLINKYPNKRIFAVGDEAKGYAGLYPQAHSLTQQDYIGALGIVVDTANKERISGEHYTLCDRLIKIDHHLPVDNYGIINIVDETKSSCAEIVTEVLRAENSNVPLPLESANNLYSGIISDTQGFSIPSVTPETFEAASYLMRSNINPSEISLGLRQMDLEIFKFQAFASNNIEFVTSKFAYLEITRDQLEQFNIDLQQVKFLVNTMRNIKGLKVWTLLIEGEPGIYSASIRSHAVDINQVARQFDGGGHLFASGVKNLDNESKKRLLTKLQACSEM